MRIYLTGFMGAGKTSIGRELAARLEMPFLDLDDWIEQNEGLTITEIFTEKGELEFRKIEAKWLRETAAFEKAIIASGGGTPCFFDNMTWMNDHGFTVFIQVSAEVLASRLRTEKEKRPLLAGLSDKELASFVNSKLSERLMFYEQSHLTLNFNADNQSALEELSVYLKKFLRN